MKLVEEKELVVGNKYALSPDGPVAFTYLGKMSREGGQCFMPDKDVKHNYLVYDEDCDVPAELIGAIGFSSKICSPNWEPE